MSWGEQGIKRKKDQGNRNTQQQRSCYLASSDSGAANIPGNGKSAARLEPQMTLDGWSRDWVCLHWSLKREDRPTPTTTPSFLEPGLGRTDGI